MIRGRLFTRLLPLLLLGAGSHVPVGCSIVCTLQLVPNLDVQVRDQSGQPAALGASGVVLHYVSGTRTELFGVDSLRLVGNWQRESAGRYSVEVRKPGFKTVRVETDVDVGECGVKTRSLDIQLEPDPPAVAMTPLQFLKGDQVRGTPVTMSVRVVGDTLEIAGNSGFACGGLKAVAYRTETGGSANGRIMHVQLEPENWAQRQGPCAAPNGPFELKYLLPQGRTELMVTMASGSPLRFHGDVMPLPRSNPSPGPHPTPANWKAKTSTSTSTSNSN
jgi:hypothetical protein